MGRQVLRAGLAALVAAVAPGPASAATLAELAGWCAPGGEPGNDRLCGAYLETIFTGLASTDPVMNGGNRTCVPENADRAEIVRLVRAYAAKMPAPDKVAALDGVGAAIRASLPVTHRTREGRKRVTFLRRWVLSRSANPQPLQGFALRRRLWPGPTASL